LGHFRLQRLFDLHPILGPGCYAAGSDYNLFANDPQHISVHQYVKTILCSVTHLSACCYPKKNYMIDTFLFIRLLNPKKMKTNQMPKSNSIFWSLFANPFNTTQR